MKIIFVAWFLLGGMVICGQAEVQSMLNSILFQDKILRPGIISFDKIIEILLWIGHNIVLLFPLNGKKVFFSYFLFTF